jgi:hypothetical protein
MPPTTPISRNKTSALTRVLDLVPRGYHRYTLGTVSAAKAVRLGGKFHARHAIGATPAQRLIRKRRGEANALLVLYWPEHVDVVDWLLLATDGDGLAGETLLNVADKPRLLWLGYELLRHPNRGRTSWTWRRPAREMAEHYALLDEFLRKRQPEGVRALLERLAHQPGFHGVRNQSWALCQEARRRGYAGELPHLYYVQKISHGEPLLLNGVESHSPWPPAPAKPQGGPSASLAPTG